jgi:hypothetical protein
MPRAAQFGRSSSLLVTLLTFATTATGSAQPARVVANGTSTQTAAEVRSLTVRLTGTPAEDAWIEITPLLSQAEPTLISLAAGSQDVSLPTVPAGPLLVCAGAQDKATECVRWLGETESLSIGLLPGTRVSGRCIRDSKPVQGAKISIAPARLTAQRAFTVPLQRRAKRLEREVASDASGSFALPRISPGEYLLQIVSPGGRIQTSGPFEVPRSSRSHPKTAPGIPTLDLGEFVVEGGEVLPVVVTDTAGAPLSGATVGANQGVLPNVTFFSATADEEGRATLSGFEPLLPVTVVCQNMGFKTLRQSFDSLPATVVCALEPLATITGTVTDTEGEAVPGATISLRGESHKASSDEHGGFKLTDVEAGSWTLMVTCPGFDVARRSVEVRPAETSDLGLIELARGAEVHGLVRDARSRQPIPAAYVVCESPPGLGQTTTGVDGTFAFDLPRHEQLVLAVTAQGYPTARRPVAFDQLDSEQQLVIELSEGGRLFISAWDDETDFPCAGCSVSVSAPGSRIASLITDSNGEAQSAPLAPGTYNVSLGRLRTTGMVFQMSGGDAQRWVDVKAGVTTHVQLGSPPTEVEVHLTATPSPEWTLIGVRATGVSPGKSLGSSSYLVKFRRGESMELWLHDARGSRVLIGALSAGFKGTAAEFDLPQGLVRGQLVTTGAGVSGHRLDVLSYDAGQMVATVSTLTGGFFSVPYLHPGTYAIVANQAVLGTFPLAHQQQLDVGRLEIHTP